jgi:hypothetical protein
MVHFCPLLQNAAVPQQERVQPLLRPLTVTEQVAAGADQVPDRFLVAGRDPDPGSASPPAAPA